MGSAFDLDGKVAWVTGAGKGLGRQMALALASAGAVVVATARTGSDLRSLVEEIGEMGRSAFAAPGSVADTDFVDRCVEQIVAQRGGLDVLVNCAGISPVFCRSEKLTDEDWSQVLRINLDGTFACARAAARHMLSAGGGSIVNISSIHAQVGFDRIAAYAASKGGVEALTKVLAVEWADRGVRVNSVAPGYFRTDLSSGLLDSSWGDRILGAIPMSKLGDPKDLANSVVFLASDAARYITGTTLVVDGGQSAH